MFRYSVDKVEKCRKYCKHFSLKHNILYYFKMHSTVLGDIQTWSDGYSSEKYLSSPWIAHQHWHERLCKAFRTFLSI